MNPTKIIALLVIAVGLAGCKKPVVKACGYQNTFVGYNAGIDNMECSEHDDTAIGANAKIARGMSGTTEIGPGLCAIEGAVCINGVLTEPQRHEGEFICSGKDCDAGEIVGIMDSSKMSDYTCIGAVCGLEYPAK